MVLTVLNVSVLMYPFNVMQINDNNVCHGLFGDIYTRTMHCLYSVKPLKKNNILIFNSPEEGHDISCKYLVIYATKFFNK